MSAHQAPEFKAMAQVDKLLDPFDAAARGRILADAARRASENPAPPPPATVMATLTTCLAALDPLDEPDRAAVVSALDALADGWRTTRRGTRLQVERDGQQADGQVADPAVLTP